MVEKLKKSDLTRAKLMQAMWELILEGDKVISVKTITERADTAYGSFYRYFKNLDQVHKELIEHRATILAEFGEAELGNIQSPLLRLYVGYYFAIGIFQQENVYQWLRQHPNFMNQTWATFTHATAEAFLKESLEIKDVPEFTQENYDHYLRVREYIYWTYQHIIRQLNEGNKLDIIYQDFMDAVNLFNLPPKIHQNLTQEAIKLAVKYTLPT